MRLIDKIKKLSIRKKFFINMVLFSLLSVAIVTTVHLWHHEKSGDCQSSHERQLAAKSP